ncbi:hypothetical protein ACFOUO_13235 [Salinithrix halophila]|uniref:Uncharacterized protein n=2 Tax=Salinithrix halophila TaxID=1485204 RepID=A0ABV8JFN8_9BACL
MEQPDPGTGPGGFEPMETKHEYIPPVSDCFTGTPTRWLKNKVITAEEQKTIETRSYEGDRVSIVFYKYFPQSLYVSITLS